MTLRDNVNEEPESFREAFDKVLACINTSTTTDQLKTTRNLFDNFVKLHNPKSIYKVFLEFRMESLEKELIKEMNDGE